MLTMLLGGLWHGAGWTFIVWGLHGIYLVINHFWHALRRRLGHDLRRSTWLGRVAGADYHLSRRWPGCSSASEDFDAANRILAGMAGINGVRLPACTRACSARSPTLEALGWVFQDADGFHFGGMSQIVLLTTRHDRVPVAKQPRVDGLRGAQRRCQPRSRAHAHRAHRSLATAGARRSPTVRCLARCSVTACRAAFAETPSEFLYFQF